MAGRCNLQLVTCCEWHILHKSPSTEWEISLKLDICWASPEGKGSRSNHRAPLQGPAGSVVALRQAVIFSVVQAPPPAARKSSEASEEPFPFGSLKYSLHLYPSHHLPLQHLTNSNFAWSLFQTSMETWIILSFASFCPGLLQETRETRGRKVFPADIQQKPFHTCAHLAVLVNGLWISPLWAGNWYKLEEKTPVVWVLCCLSNPLELEGVPTRDAPSGCMPCY